MSFKRRAAAMFALLVVLLQVPRPVVAWAADVGSGVGSGAGLGSGAGSGTGAGSGLGAGADLGGTALQDGVSIWEGGDSFHVMYKGVERTLTLPYDVKEYLVASETYTDTDGAGVTVIYFNLSFLSDSRWEEKIGLDGNEVDTDGELYYHIRMHAPNTYWEDSYCTYSYYITVKNGAIGDFVLARRGIRNGLGPSAIDITLADDTSYGRRAGRIYKNLFFQGKYTIYCSSPIYCADTYPPEVVYPAAPLSGVSPAGGGGGYPYKTTFRVLADGATVYNTYYYTSSYMSGVDEISASGKIRLDAVKLVDGTVSRALLSAPQPLCQKSTYGTAYDIVSTNDGNLISLLGIQKPVERYWDVAAQEWKVSIGSGIGPGTGIGGGGTPAPNPTPSPGTGTGFQLDYGLSPLANFSRWLQAKGYPVASNVAYLFAIESVADFGSLVAEYLGLYTYNEAAQRFGAASDGVTDLWKKVSDTSVASAVTKEFTDRFSYDRLSGHYVWSPDAVASVSVAGLGLAIASGTGGGGGTPGTSGTPTPTQGGTGTGGGTGAGTGGGTITIGGPGWDVVGDISSSVQTGIVDGVSSTGGFLSGVLTSAGRLFADLGSVPALLAGFFSFLPADIITAIGVGLSLWLLPALLGLARGGLRGLGSIFSSLFSFISSFFK